jgi:hypothetical protein
MAAHNAFLLGQIRAFLPPPIDVGASIRLTSLQTFVPVGPGEPMPRDAWRRIALVGAGGRAEMLGRARTAANQSLQTTERVRVTDLLDLN